MKHGHILMTRAASPVEFNVLVLNKVSVKPDRKQLATK